MKLNAKRNDIQIGFTDTQIQRGKNKGKTFLAPTIVMVPVLNEDGTAQVDGEGNAVLEEKPLNKEQLVRVIQFMSEDKIFQIARATFRQLAKGWSEEARAEATDETTGVMDEQKFSDVFTNLAESFSARGETIKELQGQIDELTNEFTSIDFKANPTEAIKRAEEIGNAIKDLQIAISLKKRTSKDEEEEESNGVPAK
jgi:hypothetical protein